MNGMCSLWNDCKSYNEIGCKGCGFQHFDRVEVTNSALAFLKKAYFKSCSENRKCTGGRVNLDIPMRKLILEKAKDIIHDFPEIKVIKPKSIRSHLEINGEQVCYEIKCDGSFKFDNKYVFYELKGYGDGTNDILSAITASQLIKEDDNFDDYRYYYMGINSAKKGKEGGLSRNDYFDPKRIKITPYTKWAESKGLIKFYGILNILDFLEEIKGYLNGF